MDEDQTQSGNDDNEELVVTTVDITPGGRSAAAPERLTDVAGKGSVLTTEQTVEGCREIISRMFDLSEACRQITAENDRLKWENHRLLRRIKVLVEQSQFMESRYACGEHEFCAKEKGENKEQGYGYNGIGRKTADVHDARTVEQRLLDEMKERNEMLISERTRLLNENAALTAELERLINNVEIHRAPCGCDLRSLKRVERDPLKDDAERLYRKALNITEDKNAERNEKRSHVFESVYTMILGAVRDHNKKHQVRMSRSDIIRLKENLSDIAEEITGELLSVRDIGVHQVAQIVNQTHATASKYIDIAEAKPAKFRDLCSLLGARKSSEPYFEMLRGTVSDALNMNIPLVWREKESEGGADKSLREHAAKSANMYARAMLGPHQLDAEVVKTNSIQGLRAIIWECMNKPGRMPVNERNFKRLVSAATKIRLMHLAETIKSQIDFNRNNKITAHVRAKIESHTDYTADGEPVLTISTPQDGVYEKDDRNDSRSIKVHSIDIRDGKGEVSVARKYTVKDADGNNDFDTSKIYDFIGLRIMLTERDSQTFTYMSGLDKEESPIEQATKKIISILCAIFGTDIPKSRLRYSFEAGEVNGYSTGKHRAFQLTFRYRHQCHTNGINGGGTPRMQPAYVEVQIVVKMDRDAQEKDHQEYEKKKDLRVQNIMGMDRSFAVWMSDLADVVLDEKEPVCAALSPGNLNRLTDREIMAKMLFMAITGKDESGRLENREHLDTLLNNDHEKRKLRKAAKKYLEYELVARRNAIGRGYDILNVQTSLNRLAAEALEIIDGHIRE